VKIKIERPDKDATVDIFNRYVTTELPIHEETCQSGGDRQAAVDRMIRDTVEEMYRVDEDNGFLEVTYGNGDREVLYFKDFASGAMIESVVVRDEFKENEDLPNTTNPDDWAKIAGKKGERTVSVKPLTGECKQERRDVERIVATGQYL
jgi:proteasome-associated ATPase